MVHETKEPMSMKHPHTRGTNKHAAEVGATMEATAQLDVMTELLEISTTSNEPLPEVIGAAFLQLHFWGLQQDAPLGRSRHHQLPRF